MLQRLSKAFTASFLTFVFGTATVGCHISSDLKQRSLSLLEPDIAALDNNIEHNEKPAQVMSRFHGLGMRSPDSTGRAEFQKS
ncbi:hypothetical protein K439DRAFT_1628418 [Ramaria rubella]|nr:hypothetical protein K439DRAFT_1628418 [Ramaria rubella]